MLATYCGMSNKRTQCIQMYFIDMLVLRLPVATVWMKSTNTKIYTECPKTWIKDVFTMAPPSILEGAWALYVPTTGFSSNFGVLCNETSRLAPSFMKVSSHN